ncbi:hypothetical protein FCV25MIE_26714 [Fagus crenata]
MGQTTYAGAMGKGVSMKSGKEKEQMVAQSLLAKETKRRDDTEKRIFVSGLKISVNELGVRRVLWEFKEDAALPRVKWVPKATVVKPKELGQITKAQVPLVPSGLGSSTYEVGEAS